MVADPDQLYVCEICKLPKPAAAFFRRNNKSGIKYSNKCRVCSNRFHGRVIKAASKRLTVDGAYVMDRLERLGPQPIPIKDGWSKYNKWKLARASLLARAGWIDKNPFDIVVSARIRVKYGRISEEEAEKIIESYYERHPESRPKPEESGGVIRPDIGNVELE